MRCTITLMALLLAAACPPPASNEGEGEGEGEGEAANVGATCSDDAECSTGLVCSNLSGAKFLGKCTTLCQRDDDCGNGQICHDIGERSVCVELCSGPESCSGDGFCLIDAFGLCSDTGERCGSDFDCVAGLCNKDGLGFCVVSGGNCSVDEDCVAGTGCATFAFGVDVVEGLCLVGRRGGEACEPPQRCGSLGECPVNAFCGGEFCVAISDDDRCATDQCDPHGLCSTVCDFDQQCPDGWHCAVRLFRDAFVPYEQGHCELGDNSGAPCVSSANCAEGDVCAFFFLYDDEAQFAGYSACTTPLPDDQPAGARCEDDRLTDEIEPVMPCASRLCGGVCRDLCADDSDCENGQECRASVCLNPDE